MTLNCIWYRGSCSGALKDCGVRLHCHEFQCYIFMMNGRTTHTRTHTHTHAYTHTVFISLERGQTSVVWERHTGRDGGRWKQTAILTPNFFFSLPYHAVLSSRPFVFSSLMRRTQPRATCWLRPPAAILGLRDSADHCKTETDRISGWHISFHNTHTFSFDHVTTSAYFQRCILCREYLTVRSRFNMQHLVNSDLEL